MEEKFTPDFETPVDMLSQEAMAEQYLKIRMEHMKNTEIEKKVAEDAKAKADHMADIRAEIHKYFK